MPCPGGVGLGLLIITPALWQHDTRLNKRMKTLVLGLGNSILTDDGVGLRVAAEIDKRNAWPGVTVVRSELGGLNLLELLVGYDKAIILDAIHTKDGKPGQIYKLNEASAEASHHANSAHGIDFKGVIELGRRLGLDLPDEFVIFAIEAADTTSFGERLTPAVERAVPLCVEEVIEELNDPATILS